MIKQGYKLANKKISRFCQFNIYKCKSREEESSKKLESTGEKFRIVQNTQGNLIGKQRP